MTAVGSLEERGRAHPVGLKPLPSPFALVLHRKGTVGGQGCWTFAVAVPSGPGDALRGLCRGGVRLRCEDACQGLDETVEKDADGCAECGDREVVHAEVLGSGVHLGLLAGVGRAARFLPTMKCCAGNFWARLFLPRGACAPCASGPRGPLQGVRLGALGAHAGLVKAAH